MTINPVETPMKNTFFTLHYIMTKIAIDFVLKFLLEFSEIDTNPNVEITPLFFKIKTP